MIWLPMSVSVERVDVDDLEIRQLALREFFPLQPTFQ